METLWQRCIDRLSTEISVNDLHLWLNPIHAIETQDGLDLLAPNQFVRDAVAEKFLPRIIELAAHFDSRPSFRIRLEVGAVSRARESVRATEAAPSVNENLISIETFVPFESNLDPTYTFDAFVEGKSNELGKAAALKVASDPGRAYNPLLLYGGTGLGKTHLMHAAGNYMRAQNPGMRVLYQRSEQFFTAMLKALNAKNMDDFKRRYREVDALLIDDIQFFAGKDRTQEEFFHTFNALFEGKQQIILTCDRYPKEMENLEPRLTSRLGWGLSVAIEPPDFETRASILLTKAKEKGVLLPEEVALLIARRMRSNVRDLEGALNTLAARAHFSGRVISNEFALETLRDLMSVQERAVSLPNILKLVADYYQLRQNDILGKKRTRSLARPRQMAMALAKELTSHSLPEIGDFFSRDHTTVLHACRLIKELRDTDGRFHEDWEKLMRGLSGQ